jgi:CO/xanthine dehydrogenase Mo-binding subunit
MTTRKIEAKLHHSTIISLPHERNYSTGGGHLPGDTLVEGDKKTVTRKWQGHPPVNLNILGKPLTPIRDVIEPRVLGTAEYTPRVVLPGMLYAKFLRTPYPRANITRLDTSRAEKMPGVHGIMTHKNAPAHNPMPVELRLRGDYVAVVVAESEDLAEDAVAAIEVEYEVLPPVCTVADALSPGAPDLLEGGGNLHRPFKPGDPNYHPEASAVFRRGDVEKGFAESDIIKEFAYRFQGARVAPMQPMSCVAQWDGDRLTFWGNGQGIHPNRTAMAKWAGIPEANVTYINKYNGCSFGGIGISGSGSGFPYWGHVADLAKAAGRPVKALMTKEEEMVHLAMKPEVVSTFKVGLKRDGKIHALKWAMHAAVGYDEGAGGTGGLATTANTQNHLEFYTVNTPHWERLSYVYKSNTPAYGCNRSCAQQEIKWAWGVLIDELAEAVGMDPVQFRRINMAKPGDKLTSDYEEAYKTTLESETVDGKAFITYDSFASVEVLEEGAKAIGWEKWNPKAWTTPGRFKRGLGMDMSQHHGGRLNYREGEAGYRSAPGNKAGHVEIDSDGYVTLRVALPDSGTNHGTAMAMLCAEMLGFSTIDRFKYIWGASNVAKQGGFWSSGNAAATNGGSALVAAEKLKDDLLLRASRVLTVDQSRLEMREGVIAVKGEPQRRVTFADLAKANGGSVFAEGYTGGRERAIGKNVGACFVEVEVDTWTGAFRIVRAVGSHDTGKLINPLIAEADMEGQFMQNLQVATQGIPWDREFPGQMHYNMGFLSMKIPTIMEHPEEISNVFIESLEPRWFYGYKGFTETTVGAIPTAIANAIYNATGVRIKDHPITAEKIIMGLKALA